MMLLRVSESRTPNRRSALSRFWSARTSRFLARISARAMRQSFSALVLAMSSCEAAWRRVISAWRNCQMVVATSPATPMTKLERKPWYFWMNWPSRDSAGGPSSAATLERRRCRGGGLGGRRADGRARGLRPAAVLGLGQRLARQLLGPVGGVVGEGGQGDGVLHHVGGL